jgi:2-keto-3-deoxy-L-rhamnonate aldolase RhmA
MQRDSLKRKLRDGAKVYGTCVTVTSPTWPQVVAGTGVDFVFIDTEHIPLDRADLSRLCQVYTALNVTPIVRIPKPDPFLACQAIDGGAIGVVAPYLEEVREFRELAGAIKYRPLKGEKLAAILSGEEQLSPELDAYIRNYNKGNLFIANIESVPAMERLDELLLEPGLDGVFIGPHDLSVSMDLPEQYDHPEFENAVKTIIQKTRARRLHVGIHFSLEPERQIKWVAEGANMVVHSFDIALFKQRLAADLQLIRSAVGDVFETGENEPLVV